MREFTVAISGVLVGGLMTLSGTVLQAKMTAAAAAKLELRGKLELLLQVHESHWSCQTEFMASGKLGNDCIADRHANKAISLAQIYFPDLVESLKGYSAAVTKASTARYKCVLDYPGKSNGPRQGACIAAIPGVNQEVTEAIAQVGIQAQKLRE